MKVEDTTRQRECVKTRTLDYLSGWEGGQAKRARAPALAHLEFSPTRYKAGGIRRACLRFHPFPRE
ncbi:MAG: hypothetical protein ACR2G5_00420 [Pyrinomonadaceae bacterium]